MNTKMFLAAILTMAFSATTASAAIVWDVANDFRIDSNPNGAWSYGWTPSISGVPTLPSFSLYDKVEPGAAANPTWRATGQGTEPNLFKNIGSGPVYNIQSGEVALHPGSGGQFSAVRWTSPLTGGITVRGTFGEGHYGVVGYYIYVGETEKYAWASRTNGENFEFAQNVTAGSTLTFLVGNGYIGGNTPLALTIVPVPLPAALWLFGSAVAGLAMMRHRGES